MRTPPANIELIMHCYYSPEPDPFAETSVGKLAIADFIRDGLIEPDPGNARVTERGRVWVEMICATPYPERVSMWRNPATGESATRP